MNPLEALAAHADHADAERVWPSASWQALQETGALRWSIPQEFGGAGLEGIELQQRCAALAGACMTSCFLLSQRDAAARRLRDSHNEELRRELLPGLARGESFATVGLSHLTTSRQHTGPALVARTDGSDFILDGITPWVTGACHAGHLVIGAVLEDRQQVLLVVPSVLPGVQVQDALDLMALRGSMTAEVRFDNVRVDRRWLLAGPAEKVMPAGGGGLETSCLALGLAGAAIDYMRREAEARPPLTTPTDRLEQKLRRAWDEARTLLHGHNSPDAAAFLRGRANTLVLQATQAALTASKGTGFVRPHAAQRWARQALFFLVWSCPWPAASATLEYLSDAGCPS